MAGEQQRPRIGGYVSEDAYAGWARFAAREGLTITAMIEALGLCFAELEDDEGIDLDAVVAAARRIVAERNARRMRPID